MNSIPCKASTIAMSMDLPRIVLTPRGRVAHVPVDPACIWGLNRGGDWIGVVACHAADRAVLRHSRAFPNRRRARFATDEDPTCTRCLKALATAVNGKMI